jgi:hypothetical protein
MIAASDMASVPVSRGLPHLAEMAMIGIRKDARLLFALMPIAVVLTLLVWRWQPNASGDVLAVLAAAPLLSIYFLVRIADVIPPPPASQITEARRRIGDGQTARIAKWVIAICHCIALICFMSAGLYSVVGLHWVVAGVMVAGSFALLAGVVVLLVFSLCFRIHNHVGNALETLVLLSSVLVRMKSEDLRHRLNAGVAGVRF